MIDLAPREVMNVRQAAEYLGVSTDSLYKFAMDGVVPGFKLGGRWKFKKSLLDRWMEQRSAGGVAKGKSKNFSGKKKGGA